MSTLIIGRNKLHEFLGIGCKGAWFKVVPEPSEDVRYKAVIVSLRGEHAQHHQNFLRDQLREDRNNPGRLDRWIDFLIKQNYASVFTVSADNVFGGAVVFHKPDGTIEVISEPFCIGRLGDDVDSYVAQRGFDNCFRQVVDNTGGDDDEAIHQILTQLIEAGALQGHIYVHEYA